MPADSKVKGVYYHDQPSWERPSAFVSLEEARRLKAEGKAVFINHGTCIRLFAKRPIQSDAPDRRGMVSSAGDRVIVTASPITYQRFSEIRTQLQALEFQRVNELSRHSAYLAVTTEQMT
jgi:hypothetical protein